LPPAPPRDDSDRDVDEEDPLPAQHVGQHAADEGARGAAGRAHRAPYRERAVALGALAEGRGEDGERRRRHDRAAQTLERAGDDQLALALGQTAGQGRGGEQQEPEEQDLLVPEQVRRAPAEQEEAGERDRVGVDDPLQVDDREAEVIADRRQRDVHDRHVEDDHELREAAEDEGPALRDVRG
jgi:hypothetical protein